MKVKDHFGIAEYQGGDYSHPVAGHYYSYKNDPSGHGNHVHVAFLPWGEPDEPNAHPKDMRVWTPAAEAYYDAFVAKFGGDTYRWGGTYVYKHRNGDPTQAWSQHAFGNAVDFMANGSDQDPIINWLESEWEPPMTQDEFNEMWKTAAKQIAGVGPNRLKEWGDGALAAVDFGNGDTPTDASRLIIVEKWKGLQTPLPPSAQATITFEDP